jgi:hypothetical protein
MRLANVMPGLGEFSHRIFECGACGHLSVTPEAKRSLLG